MTAESDVGWSWLSLYQLQQPGLEESTVCGGQCGASGRLVLFVHWWPLSRGLSLESAGTTWPYIAKVKKNLNLSFYLCAVPKHVCCKPALFRILLAKLLYYRLFVFKTKHFWNFWCIYRTCFALKFTALFFLLPHCQLVFGLASWWSQLGPGSLPSFGQLECGFIHCNHDPNVCSSILPFVNTTY